jgi:hypothetical protein
LNIINLIFDDLKKPNGKPNTTSFGIFFKSVKTDFRLNKIDIKDKPKDLKYFYLIEPFGGIANCIDYGNQFVGYMSKKVADDVKNNKCYIIISSMSEGHLETRLFFRIHQLFKKYGLPTKNLIIIQNNNNLKKQYDEYCSICNIKDEDRMKLFINRHKFESCVESFTQLNRGEWDFSVYPKRPTLNSVKEVLKIKSKNREHRFLSYNKSLREDRVALLSLFYSKDLIDKGLISMGAEHYGSAGQPAPWPNKFDFITDKSLLGVVKEWSKKLESLRPMSIDGEPNVNNFDEGKHKGLNPCGYTYADQYRRIYFQVVTEDIFDADSIFFSQTTYAPIIQLTPFIMFGSPHMMKNLREVQGFKTFSPWIDESYDDIEDNNKRFIMIVNEIERLCNLSEKNINKMYYDMLSILIYNRDRLINHKNEDHNNIFKYLYGIIGE